MLFRLLVVVTAALEVLYPRRLVDFWMGVAAKGDQDVELHSWVYLVARLEGVLILLWVLHRYRNDTA